MSAPPPPSPPRKASTAAALVADLRTEGVELAKPPASLFHVNNKYSHRRPRLVCSLRLPILLPRPFTPRGAWIRAGDRARDRQSLLTNQSPLGAGGASPRGRGPGVGREWDTPVVGPLQRSSPNQLGDQK